MCDQSRLDERHGGYAVHGNALKTYSDDDLKHELEKREREKLEQYDSAKVRMKEYIKRWWPSRYLWKLSYIPLLTALYFVNRMGTPAMTIAMIVVCAIPGLVVLFRTHSLENDFRRRNPNDARAIDAYEDEEYIDY